MGRLPLLSALALFLAVPAEASRFREHLRSREHLWIREGSEKNRPVSKVIRLLKSMLKQLEKQSEEDEEVYDKLACWCKTNDQEKTESIQKGQSKLEDLSSKIEELTAKSSRLNAEIKRAEKEVMENQAALGKATAIREKQLEEFGSEQKELLESVSALKAAVTVLAKHQGGEGVSLLQKHAQGLASALQREMQRRKSKLKLTAAQHKAALAFIQQPEEYFDASPTFQQSYAPQSGEIDGVLRQMLETFQGNLAQAQEEEGKNQKAYAELKAAKEAEIKAGQSRIDVKTQELASTDEANAQAKADSEDLKASLAADEQFLMNLKEKCSMTDSEWEERQRTRKQEMEAVSKALSILSSDDAHDLFSKTFNPALLQKEVKMGTRQRTAAEASKMLSEVAKKLRNPRLATLAYRVRLDAFSRVKKAIDDMVAQLLKEKEDEIKHKDFCVDEFNSNQLETEDNERESADLTSKIEGLQQDVKALGNEVATLKAEIAEMQTQMKRAGEDREKENQEFQSTVADQRATQRVLKSALAAMQNFYGEGKAALVQEESGAPPPPGFSSYKKSASAGGVLGLMRQIINDAKAMEAEATRADIDAQRAYEDFVKETNGSIEAKSAEIVNKSEEKATKESDLVRAKESQEAVGEELEQLSNYNAELHQSCDFVTKNFDVRQSARDEEVDALRKAQAILSGAKFDAFLQG